MQQHHGAGRPGGRRVYLDVPYAEKNAAKAAGARWDPAARRWYDPRPPTAALERWAALPEVPELLPGEDRTFGHGLFVDLVPTTCWFTNVRTCVSPRDWDRLRRMILGRAGHRCEICGATEDRTVQRWLEAHERWHYQATGELGGVQALRRLICLCSPCHLVTHFGHANVTGRTEEAFAHLRAVTGMTQQQAVEHVFAAERLWLQRSEKTWDLDLRMLTDAHVALAGPGVWLQAADRDRPL
ncbi:DNA primase [Pseudonocardia sp. CNS-139]|nr:DNA primase [Pseudonocardia sp. CNS-139]